MGAINVGTLREEGIERILYAGEITFKPEVTARKKNVEKFKSFSTFPPANRDLAVIAKIEEKASDVINEVAKIAKQKTKGCGFEMVSLELFDSYAGKGVEDGFKSLAMSMSFRSEEKTLQAEEVNKIFDAICVELSKKRKLRIA